MLKKLILFFTFCAVPLFAETPLYLDASQPVEARVEDLLSRLTLDEKISLIHANSKFTVAGVERLGIPERYLSDGPHGVRQEIGPHSWAPAGRTDDYASYLPNGTALASTWNPEMALEFGRVLGNEANARGKAVILGPAVNIQRTPLCGRNFEYFGEDPYLAAQIAVPYIRGVQEQDVAACIKHFAVNNQEVQRGSISVEVDERALREIYLPAFEAAVKEGGVLTVMGAYNKLRGQHCCHNDYLLNRILKGEWGFQGLVMSDWGGTHDTREAALNGLDLEMGTFKRYNEYYLADPFKALLESGEIPMSVLDDKVRRNLRVMFLTKLFDSDRKKGTLNDPKHAQSALKIAREAIVLLKNDGILPLKVENLKTIAVIGENAVRKQAPGGGSSEIKALYEITPLEGLLKAVGAKVNIVFSLGYAEKGGDDLIAKAVNAAKNADVVLVFTGLSHYNHGDAEGTDRFDITLPFGQDELVWAVVAANPRTVVVNISGSPVAMPWAEQVPAIVQAWYSGMEAGTAIADVLFGVVNPSGKLCFTFPHKLSDSPAHALNAYPGEKGVVTYKEGIFVGYRWYEKENIPVLFPFGHGLSYTRFDYSDLKIAPQKDGTAIVSVKVSNSGPVAGKEVVQLYVGARKSSVPRPPKELKAFAKVALNPGESQVVTLNLGKRAFAFYQPEKGQWIAEKGSYDIYIGSSSQDIRLKGELKLKRTTAVD